MESAHSYGFILSAHGHDPVREIPLAPMEGYVRLFRLGLEKADPSEYTIGATMDEGHRDITPDATTFVVPPR